MFKKLTAVTITIALVCMLGGTSVFARCAANPDEKIAKANVPAQLPAKEEAKPNQQLKTSILKLVADAKAGKIAPAGKSQFQPAKSNGWSKRTKIIVGVTAVVVVVAIIVVKHELDHFFDGAHPFRND